MLEVDEAETVGSLFERITRSEFGGCHPWKDSEIKLKVRIQEKMIQVFVVGKWRNMRQYFPHRIPTNKVMDEIARTIRLNAGWEKDEKLRNKPIVWDWIIEREET